MGANLIYVDAVDRFLDKLAGVGEPEQKRKIIGAEFIRVFEEEARKLEGIEFLGQGTIYPDIIESGTKTVKAVKAHHNVGGLPEDLKFELVEPLKYLFKDEVRACGQGSGSARLHGLPPAVPRSRPGRALSGRHHPRPAGGRRGSPTPSSGRSSPRPVWRARCGSTSPPCPTSSPWACASDARADEWPGHSSAPSTPWTP